MIIFFDNYYLENINFKKKIDNWLISKLYNFVQF